MTMEPEESWDKDEESRHFMPDLSNDPKENLDDDPNLLQPFVPDIEDMNIDPLSYENDCADVGCQSAMNSLESSDCEQDSETKSTGSSSDFSALVIGNDQYQNPKDKVSDADVSFKSTETFDGTVVTAGSSVDTRQIQSSSDHEESTSTSAYSPINCLNDDAMAHIFAYLSLKERLLAERVCRRWRLLSLQFWSSIKRLEIWNIMNGKRYFTDHDLKKLLQRGSSSLCSLDLSHYLEKLTDRSLNAIAKWCENLRELSLYRMNISNKGLQTLAEKCRKLEVIKIQDCQSVGEKGLWWVFHRCKKLKQVNLKGIMGLEGQCLHILCGDVLDLDLTNCVKLMDVGIQKVHENCPQLQDLSVANCCSLTDAAFTVIGQCNTIKSLDISSIGPHVTMSGLMALRHLTHLEHLKAFNCNHAFKDPVLMAVSQGCHHLRSVIICNVSRSQAADQITDIGVESLAANCPLLSSVDLGYRPEVSDSSLMSLSQLDHLKELVINGSIHITDIGVISVLNGCPVLQKLDVSRCEGVTDSSISAAVSRMKEDQSRTLELVIIGTSFNSFTVPTGPANLKVSGIGYSKDDIDYMFADASERYDKYRYYDYDYDGHSDNDHPLAEEEWNMS